MNAVSKCACDAEVLRAIMREEFGMRGRRDMSVAEAVNAWYLRAHPELALMVDQPNLENIVAGVPLQIGSPVLTPLSADQWTTEELAEMRSSWRPEPPPNKPQADIWSSAEKGGFLETR